MKCNKCNNEMIRVFTYEGNKLVQKLSCPDCGANTKTRDVTFTDSGDVVIATTKNNEPMLYYQVSNPNNENTYGNLIKAKKSSNKNEKRKREVKSN